MFSTFRLLCNYYFLLASFYRSGRSPGIALFALAYTTELMPRRCPGSPGLQRDRPLSPPFPNGACDGSVVTIPREDLFPGDVSFFGALRLGPFSSLDNAVLPPRDVKVWLPREYDCPQHRDRRFPVLYCHDGQNAMDDASSWTGSSWRLIGALTRLSERKMLRTDAPPIVVCIPHGEGDFLPGISRRHSEYGDFAHPVSQAHGDFVARRLHPYVAENFRVADGPEHASAIGSSLGGQASLQLVLRYPGVFGGAACLSPCFQPGTIAAVAAKLAADDETFANFDVSRLGTFLRQIESRVKSPGKGRKDANPLSLRSKRIYIDNGGDAGDTRVPIFEALDHFTLNERWWNPGYWWLDTNLQPMVDAMKWILDEGGVELTYEKFPGGRHNERAWGQRIHWPLLALYGKSSEVDKMK